MQNFNLRRSRDIGDILTDTFQYIRIHYQVLGKGLLFFVMPLYLVNAFLLQEYSSQLIGDIFDPNNLDALQGFFSGRYFLAVFFSIVAYSLIPVIILNHMDMVSQGLEPQVSDLIEDSLPLILKIIGLNIIIAFIVGFSFLFLFFPAIFFGIKLSLAQSALILEGRDIMGSINRSWDLTKDFWWATFALLLIMYIITVFTTYVFILPTAILSIFFVDGVAAGEGSMFITFITTLELIFNAVGSLFTAIIQIAVALHFFNLVERREGGNLRSKIEGLAD